MSPPPKCPGKLQRLEKLIEEWTRIEVGLRMGCFPKDLRPKGGLSLANDVADKADEIRELALGTSDYTVLCGRWFKK